ncbi:hypothetical protein HID58_088324 [Brassica napus]|uniref:Pentatricopeptide repeat-containing protein n=1 Tax=Brassica napus TaxID=3708 RepID=A0ABQ7XVV6_BRANA|nr:hypothetical protein HID58_088324 [Brassica napus]
MNRFSIIPCSLRLSSIVSYAELIEFNGRDRLLSQARKLHAHLVTSGIARLTRIAAKLVAFYVECGEVTDAKKVFDEMPKRDISGWVVMIGACARNGYYQESLNIFREMNGEGLKLDAYIVPSVLKASRNLLDQEFGKMMHCVVLKCSFESDGFIVSSLIDMYSKFGEVENARKVFSESSGQDLVVFNAMISGYANNSQADEALNLVGDMKLAGIQPDVITWNALIAGFSHIGDEEKVSEMLEMMCLDGHKPDVVSWTSIISGLVHNFQNAKALDAFKQMLAHGLYPNSATITTLLPACTTLANVKHGKEIHGYSVVSGLEDHGFVRSALLDMYGKCGFISEAMILFHKTTKKTTVTFNSMIFCYANHGLSEKAVELFEQMEATGERLDHLTFTAILTACSHGGLTDLGQKLFLLMQNKYRIEPRLEHYACMVDLLGRAGKVVEAYEMIRAMLMEPDLFVWGALLGACRNHGNIELARIAAERLAELEPENSGNRLLLSSLYANAGSWGSVVRMKKMIKKKKLSRVPGSSWVVSGNVFVALVAASAGDAYYLSSSKKKRRGLIPKVFGSREWEVIKVVSPKATDQPKHHEEPKEERQRAMKAAVNMMTLALASATELLASHCIEMADRECVAATVLDTEIKSSKRKRENKTTPATVSVIPKLFTSTFRLPKLKSPPSGAI